jgi:hypothetical protein
VSRPPALLVALALAGAAPAGAADPPLDLRAAPAHRGGETRCEKCHSTDRWGDVAFAHERTGFPLVAEHRKVGCKQCHPVAFDRPLAHACAACHQDVHRGQLGTRCQACHDEQSWKSRFDADAHRRAGFPLGGRHAFLACEECHGNQLDRGFSRSVKGCGDCHARDLLRANQVLPHDGFGPDCRSCHSTWRFAGAYFPAHEKCFSISSGPHVGIACARCHGGSAPRAIGSCSTPPLACTDCHFRGNCPGGHPAVLGMDATACQPANELRCYQCHRFSTTGGALRGVRSIR